MTFTVVVLVNVMELWNIYCFLSGYILACCPAQWQSPPRPLHLWSRIPINPHFPLLLDGGVHQSTLPKLT